MRNKKSGEKTDTSWEPILGIWQWLGIICLFLLILRFSITYNSPHPLESAHLTAGRIALNMDGPPIDGGIYLQKLPVLLYGIADKSGGFRAGRLMAAIIGVLWVIAYFFLVKIITGDGPAAFISAFLFSMEGSALFTSKFATGDVMACLFFTLFCIGTAYGKMHPEKAPASVLLGSILLIPGLLLNYRLLLWLPVIFTVVFILFPKWKTRGAFLLSITAGISLMWVWDGFSFSLLFPHPGGSYGLYQVLKGVFQYVAFPAVLFTAAWRMEKKPVLKPGLFHILLAGALTPVIYHLFRTDPAESFRLLSISSFFLLIPSGLVIKHLLTQKDRHFKYMAVMTLSLAMTLSVFQVTGLENGFTNTDRAINLVQSKLKKDSRLLSEDPYLLPYYFYPSLPLDRFETLPHSHDPKTAEVINEINKKISKGTYSAILLNNRQNPGAAEKITKGPLLRFYELKYHEPLGASDAMDPNITGNTDVYVKPEDNALRR